MKIGIITFWQTRDNYGQMLQCWALQHALKQMGHEPFLIRYAHTEHTYPFREKCRHLIVNLLKGRFSKLILRQKKLGTLSNSEIKREFEKFKDKYLEKTNDIYYSLDDLKKKMPEADCYIVGSDQVWSRDIFSDDGRVFMLDFVPNTKKKISYAASLGSASKPQTYIKKLSSYLESFCAVSVREESGLSICSQAGIQANLVVDPTLLLVKNDYRKEFELKEANKNQIFIYSLNISDAEEIGWSKIKRLADSKNMSVVVTPSSGYILGTELFGDNVQYLYCTIHEWLNTINESRFVITTSFHGVMICLQFHTPFVYVPLNGKFSNGNNRVLDFFKYLNINIPIYSDTFEYSSIFELEWDWYQIDEKINVFRQNSIKFLNDAL